MILPIVNGANIRTVLRSSVMPRILDRALELPRRVEKPAESTTMRGMGRAAAFVGIMIQ